MQSREISANSSFAEQEAKLPTASISAKSFEEILLRWTGFFTKLGPQIRLPPVTIFGVNIPDTSLHYRQGTDC
jgi:hypothetical protein